ncbi:MAG TPA: phosphatidylglycerol lysyltransferase domain-containing protein [Candidatus Peribacteraceae bacterium]|nr:phosphatidylglycerol lysyltransferase domain-containing protein [Candidatus Peribacteraceae bacterium]
MIPKFPKFKKIEPTDKIDAEIFTQRLLPYSDFNFVSLWSWDIHGKVRLSELNGNLVVRFIDYLSGEPFYSFLGENKINETIDVLLKHSIDEGLPAELKLIPEDAALLADKEKFEVREDRDNFDYVYSIEELKNMEGKKFQKKRNQISNFLKQYPDANAAILNLEDPKIYDSIISLYEKWITLKLSKEDSFESHEEMMLKRLLSATKHFKLLGVGIFVENKMIAFFLNELTESEHVIAHASKIDAEFIGVNSYLMKKNAEILYSFDKKLFNYEQDLGLQNLRDAKSRFRPTLFFKQYCLTYRNA